jgi:hypothetical protein
VRKAVVGVIIAVALAISASDASIAGIAAWKIVLAATGAAIFVATGKGSTNGSVKGTQRSADKQPGSS